MFIAYQKQRGIEYARLMESVRVDGCVKKKSGPNLGRVLDKERGIYQSKERGIFTFDLKTNTYGKPPQSYVSNVRRKNAREKLIVDYRGFSKIRYRPLLNRGSGGLIFSRSHSAV